MNMLELGSDISHVKVEPVNFQKREESACLSAPMFSCFTVRARLLFVSNNCHRSLTCSPDTGLIDSCEFTCWSKVKCLLGHGLGQVSDCLCSVSCFFRYWSVATRRSGITSGELDTAVVFWCQLTHRDTMNNYCLWCFRLLPKHKLDLRRSALKPSADQPHTLWWIYRALF